MKISEFIIYSLNCDKCCNHIDTYGANDLEEATKILIERAEFNNWVITEKGAVCPRCQRYENES